MVAVFHGEWVRAVFLYTLSSIQGEPYVYRNTLPFSPKPLPIGSLLTLPPPAAPYPCRVEVRKRGVVLGIDMGVVTFLDGWLHYEGLRTSFSLRKADVSAHSEDRLELLEGGWIVFGPQDTLAAGEFTEVGLAARFRANLASWMRSDSAEGEPILPPITAHSTGIARARSAFVADMVFAIVVLSLAATYSSSFWTCVVAIFSGLEIVLRLRDLRRIARLSRSSPRVAAVE